MKLMHAAVSGLMMAATVGALAAEKTKAVSPDTTSECHGVNDCKGKGACGGPGRSCSGTNDCKGKGFLEMSKKDCDAKHGAFKPKP